MIYDVEKAVIDYFKTRMDDLVGKGGVTIGVYRRKFPDSAAAVGVTVYCELREAHDDVPELEPCAIRITTRHPATKEAFELIKNADGLLDKVVHLNMNDDVELCVSNRNAGPDRLPVEDDLSYFSALYNITFRSREND